TSGQEGRRIADTCAQPEQFRVPRTRRRGHGVEGCAMAVLNHGRSLAAPGGAEQEPLDCCGTVAWPFSPARRKTFRRSLTDVVYLAQMVAGSQMAILRAV